MATNVEAPPVLRDKVPYKTWAKEIYIWEKFKPVKQEKQALGIFLSLEGQARAAVDEMNPEKLN